MMPISQFQEIPFQIERVKLRKCYAIPIKNMENIPDNKKY